MYQDSINVNIKINVVSINVSKIRAVLCEGFYREQFLPEKKVWGIMLANGPGICPNSQNQECSEFYNNIDHLFCLSHKKIK